jgi:holliday junction DNA helicase RuvA
MIGRLRGEIIDRSAGVLIVDVGGVGYRVSVSESSVLRLGERVDLHIHTHVREDALQLFGFATPFELAVFDLLLTVPGVGPVKAMGVMKTSAAELVGLVLAGDPARLSKLPGVGKKTAERLVLDLKDKFAELGPIAGSPSQPPQPSSQLSARARDLLSALMNLGFREASATETVERTIARVGEDAPLEVLLKEALLLRRSIS